MARKEFGIEPAGTPDVSAAQPRAPAKEGGATGAVAEIQKLSELRKSGAITDAEFETLKAKTIQDAISGQ
jgi:hypothetical protein